MAKKIIQVYVVREEDRSKINRASEIIGLSESSFCRTSAIEKANQILRDNNEVSVKNE